MSQINIDPHGPDDPRDRRDRYDRDYRDTDDAYRAWGVIARNMSWAIAAVIVIAALALALVYVIQNLHL